MEESLAKKRYHQLHYNTAATTIQQQYRIWTSYYKIYGSKTFGVFVLIVGLSIQYLAIGRRGVEDAELRHQYSRLIF